MTDSHSRTPPLHGGTRVGRSPFGATAPSIVAALLHAALALVWVTVGQSWAPGRWIPVHLFTLGVLTNLVLVFTEHFGRTLTRHPEVRIRWQPATLNLGVVALLVGLPTGERWLVTTGATTVTAVVLVSYWRLRRMRRDAVGARFTWIVRVYERAHGAFVHGAILGALMGVGLLKGEWYGAARTAHLHVTVLGWGGLTLLATLVFFGPTLTRTRIVVGADDRAARALRLGDTVAHHRPQCMVPRRRLGRRHRDRPARPGRDRAGERLQHRRRRHRLRRGAAWRRGTHGGRPGPWRVGARPGGPAPAGGRRPASRPSRPRPALTPSAAHCVHQQQHTQQVGQTRTSGA